MIAFFERSDRLHSERRIYGESWRSKEDRNAAYELSWIADTNETCLVRQPLDELGVEDAGFDFASQMILAVWSFLRFRRRSRIVYPGVAVVATRFDQRQLDERLRGWQQAIRGRDSVSWLLDHLSANQPNAFEEVDK